MKSKFTIILLFLLSTIYYSQDLVINEVMSKNNFTIFDEDEDTPDWIELYNSSSSSILLKDYFLSDNSNEFKKWNLPNITIESKEHFLIFASGKDRSSVINHWETVVDWGDAWKYKVGDSSIPTDWNQPEYNSSSWNSGKSGIGYGDNDDNTEVPNNTNSIYMLKEFEIFDLDSLTDIAIFNMDFDDGYVAYINGVEISRANIGKEGDQPKYNDYATDAIEPKLIYGETLENIIFSDFKSLLVEGNNIIAVQVHNANANSSDLTAIPFLTLGYFKAPANASGSSSIITLPDVNVHANFKISNSGESLYLTKNSDVIDSIYVKELQTDISYGRQPSGSTNWKLFSIPTPGEENPSAGFDEQSEAPHFETESLIFTSQFTLELTSEEDNSKIYYSTDGSIPNETSNLYTAPILISSSKVISAITVSPGKLNSKVITKSYIEQTSNKLPIISLTTDPDNFFDYNTGIYVEGPNASSQQPYYGANYWMDWEKPIHIDFFETDGTNKFSIDGGVKIFGAWSRANPQKSMALFARKRYGQSSIDHQIFPSLEIDEFKSIVLRNSGNDISYSFLRDGMMQDLVNELDIDIQAYRPSIIFVNGEYWGMFNIREKINEEYLASHYDLDPDNVDILEKHGEIVEGDSDKYFELYDFINENNLSDNANYQFVKSYLDINSFQDYFISQIYFNNTDWPGNNLKLWREKTEGSKFRYLLYDTDFGFGLYNQGDYSNNALAAATSKNGRDWPNPPWSTLFLRKLLENEEFKNQFINKFCVYLATNFSPGEVHRTIDSLYADVENDILRHLTQWNYSSQRWYSQNGVLKTFASERPKYIKQHLKNKFGLGQLNNLSVDVENVKQGYIKISNHINFNIPFEGEFFSDVPVEICAIPKNGYKFKAWSGSIESTDATLNLTVDKTVDITAIFEPYDDSDSPIVINEINYNSSSDANSGDWIELYNRRSNDIILTDWIFRDSSPQHTFKIIEDVMIPANGYFVLCNDYKIFKEVFPNVDNVIGNFDFNLSNNGEEISLYNKQGNIADFVEYDDKSPWTTDPDGNGKTLSLINPTIDNNINSNWGASINNGTPGEINDIVNGIENNRTTTPHIFTLEQNYPNPFNPTTIISYQLPLNGFVELKIYNVLGQTVAILVSEEQSIGHHKINFNAKNLSSGVYISELKFGQQRATKKLLLLK